MASSSRPVYKLNLDGLGQLDLGRNNSANTSGTNSPNEGPAGSGLRYSLGGGLGGNGSSQAGPGRTATGSPSREYGGSRLFPKRTREIQAQEGLQPSVWGPPPSGSGHATPLRETIPESPDGDGFPDFDVGESSSKGATASLSSNSSRRARAGTLPTISSPFGSLTGSGISRSKSNRVAPSSTSYKSTTPLLADQQATLGAGNYGNAALFARLRAGSMPQRSGYIDPDNPFGASLLASSYWSGRDRSSTLNSVKSSEAASSPRDSPAENDVGTLGYLGLDDTPRHNLDNLMGQQHTNGLYTIPDLAAMSAFNNKIPSARFRSFSVNAKEGYGETDNEKVDYDQAQDPDEALRIAVIREEVAIHNAQVQAFTNFATANRPRARTAGMLESPSGQVLRKYLPRPSRLDSSIAASDIQDNDRSEFQGITEAMANMQFNAALPHENGFEAGMENPTKSLWLGNIPPSTTVSSLHVLFAPFGTIEFARVLTHKSCGFVNFENVTSAITARAQYNGKELFPGCGPVRINYAKEQSASNTPGASAAYPSPSPDPFVSKGRNDSMQAKGRGHPNTSINAETEAAALATPNLLDLQDEVLNIVQQLGANQEDQRRIMANLENAMSYNGYMREIPPVNEPNHARVHDAPRLREIRKRIDNDACSQMEIESIALDMLGEVAELSSDYLGNTVVQKLFENCSEDTKETLVAEIGSHLATIGVHKNGTWAAQKIIDVAHTPKQMQLIVDALRPHGVNLFLDQFGNYVMQCCLKFQYPLNSFVFDTMLNRLWDVAQGRYGARAMRACLESHFATSDQKRLMAAAIALHSVQLATSSNGALLLTWFLDTCTFPRRRSVLAPRLIPHLVHLCTHKVAYLTVLKMINQRNEPEARDSILKALFFEEQTLHDIISDPTCGATLIFKVLTTPSFDESLRQESVENVRNALLRIKAQANQGYKRLMDEVGLTTRHGGTPGDSRANSRSRQMNTHPSNLDSPQNGYGRQYGSMTPQHQQLDHSGLHRTISMDSTSFDPYVNGLATPQYTHSPSASNVGMSPQQLQYQQALLQAQMPRPPGFYGSPNGMTGLNGMAYGTTHTNQQMMDPYRNGSPMLPVGMGMQGGYPQQAYAAPVTGMNGYGQYPMPQYYQQSPMHGQTGGQRKGRR